MKFGNLHLWITLCFLMDFDLLNFKGSVSVLADQDFYSQCKDLKDGKCFGTTKSDDNTCISRRDCFIASSYSLKSDSVHINLIGKLEGNKKWIATAFSIDKQMGDDLVVICGIKADNSIVHFLSRNDKRNGTPQLPQVQQEKLELLKSSFENGQLSCELKLSSTKLTIGNNILFDLQKGKFHLMLATGDLNDDGINIDVHTYKTVSRESLSLTDTGSSQSGSQNNYLKKMNGILMVFSFMFLILATV